jgi:hypothetical protein
MENQSGRAAKTDASHEQAVEEIVSVVIYAGNEADARN